VGILGGSFNPAHEGHLHISLLALKLLKLDEVWWMVSPQNPLKSADGMAPLEDRLTEARALVRHPNIRITDIESRLGTTNTAESLAVLKRGFPKTRFVWLMGADNLKQISRWHQWTRIFNQVPIAVFDRAWMFFHTRLHPGSATNIRARRDSSIGPDGQKDAAKRQKVNK
jgi:nicotinate-nucleotide adenylyltransferase